MPHKRITFISKYLYVDSNIWFDKTIRKRTGTIEYLLLESHFNKLFKEKKMEVLLLLISCIYFYNQFFPNKLYNAGQFGSTQKYSFHALFWKIHSIQKILSIFTSLVIMLVLRRWWRLLRSCLNFQWIMFSPSQ